ncbi:MAG: glycosyltransferase family 4 protein [bacterium]
MRICLVSSAYRPYISGVGEHVHNLAQQLQSLGHSVHILTTTYRLTYKNNALPATRLGKALILPFAGGQFTLPVSLKLHLSAHNFFLRQDFDIVHCHGIFPPELAYWSAKYTRNSLVVTFHTVTPDLPNFVSKTAAFLLKEIDRKIKVKIAVSQACRRWAEKFFKGDFRVIPNGVDIERFNPKIPPVIEQNFPLILFVGRLEERKGLNTLILALPEIIKYHPMVKLLVIGNGPLKRHYLKLAARLEVDRSLIMVDTIPNDLLPGYYTSATVFVAPTIGKEAMGIVLLEALACGRPVVASDISGYKEIITNGINGILVPPNNPRVLAQEIITILDSRQYRYELAHQARLRALDFDWRKITQALEQVYKEVV